MPNFPSTTINTTAEKKLPLWAEWLGLGTTVVLGIVALSVSFYTCNLQEQANILASSDSLQRAQIDTLRNIANQLRGQGETQNRILDRTQYEINGITAVVNKTDSQNRLITDLSGLTRNQLALAIEAMNKSKEVDSFSIAVGRLKLIKAAREMDDSAGISRENILKTGSEYSDPEVYSRIDKMLTRIKKLVDDQLDNPYFIKNSALYDYWVKLSDKIHNMQFSDKVYEQNSATYGQWIDIRTRISYLSLFVQEQVSEDEMNKRIKESEADY